MDFSLQHPQRDVETRVTLAKAKEFIAVLQTCALILEKLPMAPQSRRGTMITEHLRQMDQLKATLPPNLIRFLSDAKK